MSRSIAVCLFLLGCAPRGSPEDAVKGLFAALAARDCEALPSKVGGALAERLRKEGCEAIMKDVGGMRLETIESVDVDGRDSRAWLVRVRVSNRPEPMLLRVDRKSGHYAVVTL